MSIKGDRTFCRSILSLPIEGIIVTLVAVMQKTAHEVEEGNRLPEFEIFRRSYVGRRTLFQYLQPTTNMHVAKATWTILNIWFQMKERHIMFRMPCARKFEESAHNGTVVTLNEPGNRGA